MSQAAGLFPTLDELMREFKEMAGVQDVTVAVIEFQELNAQAMRSRPVKRVQEEKLGEGRRFYIWSEKHDKWLPAIMRPASAIEGGNE